MRLPAETPVFYVPAGLLKIMDRDLVAAGLARRVKVNGKWVIDKRDDRGRTIDVHALRTSFGTLLSKGGVAPRTAQAAMRHSSIDLTMNVYTDARLLDVHGALDALPALSLDPRREPSEQRATGTHESAARKFALGFAPTPRKPVQQDAIPANRGELGDPRQNDTTRDKIAGCIGFTQSGRQDSNLRPPDPQSGALARLRHAPNA